MTRIVDLTMTIQEGMVTYPGHPPVRLTKLTNFSEHGKEISKIECGTHAGTHTDAQRHFIEDGETVESIPAEVLVGPALLLDFSGIRDFGRAISSKDLAAAARGRSVERMLLRYDGDRLLSSGMDYYNKQPYLTESAATWLVANDCKLVGMDTPMPDAPGSPDMPIHKLLLGAGIVIVEYMVNLKSIQAETFQLVVAPLKIKDGDGAPARCFAIVE